MIVRSLGPDLASGVAGVALFLARLAARSGDDGAAVAAGGAIGAALHHASTLGAHGLHEGQAGVGLAAVTVGTVLAQAAVADAGDRLLRHAAAAPVAGAPIGIRRGVAGTLLAIVGAAPTRDVGGDVDGLRSLADHVTAAAPNADELPGATPASTPADGAVALAMAELGVHTDDERLCAWARAALRAQAWVAVDDATDAAIIAVHAHELLGDPWLRELALVATGWSAGLAGAGEPNGGDTSTATRTRASPERRTPQCVPPRCWARNRGRASRSASPRTRGTTGWSTSGQSATSRDDGQWIDLVS